MGVTLFSIRWYGRQYLPKIGHVFFVYLLIAWGNWVIHQYTHGRNHKALDSLGQG